MRQKRKAHFHDALPEQEGVNLTSLIDVVFVVLILFILIAPMLDIDRIQLAEAPRREKNEKTVVNEEQSVVIHVHENNTVWVNKREIKSENLLPLLKALYQRNPKLIPQLYQDKKAFFGTYQKVKNAVEEAGYEELDMILEPKK